MNIREMHQSPAMENQLKGQSMWVIKLGGSLLGAPELQAWLNVIAKHADGKVIIVPGGSIFADAVRDAQKIAQINDAVAHQLALLAMDQYGLLLAGLHADFVTASSELEIAERSWQHRPIIWLPSKMVLYDEKVPQNWDVTSDSLSAWLATKLGVKHLVLVKSRPLNQVKNVMALNDLPSNLLDAQFEYFANGQPYQSWVVHASQASLFERGFDAAAAALIKHAVLLNFSQS